MIAPPGGLERRLAWVVWGAVTQGRCTRMQAAHAVRCARCNCFYRCIRCARRAV